MTEQTSSLAEIRAPAPPDAAGAEAAKKDKKKDKKKKNENRGIETMFKVTYQNHVALSGLADNKANMLISINGLIISIMIALVTRTGAVSWSFAPMLVLVTGCLISLGFAVFGARPRLSRSTVTLDEVRGNTANLLFFGQFTSMPLEEFQASLRALMDDRKLLYAHLGRQLYLMGQSLNRKYRYLHLAYGAFLASLTLATALFVLMYLTGRLGVQA